MNMNNKNAKVQGSQAREKSESKFVRFDQSEFKDTPSWYLDEMRNSKSVSLKNVVLVGPSLDT